MYSLHMFIYLEAATTAAAYEVIVVVLALVTHFHLHAIIFFLRSFIGCTHHAHINEASEISASKIARIKCSHIFAR